MHIKSIGQKVDIYSGDEVYTGKLFELHPDSLSYEDKNGKHLLPLSEFSMVVLGEEDATDRIKKERDRIFLKALVMWSVFFSLGFGLIILLAMVR